MADVDEDSTDADVFSQLIFSVHFQLHSLGHDNL